MWGVINAAACHAWPARGTPPCVKGNNRAAGAADRLRIMVALALPGAQSRHAARCPAVGNGAMSEPFSAKVASAAPNHPNEALSIRSRLSRVSGRRVCRLACSPFLSRSGPGWS